MPRWIVAVVTAAVIGVGGGCSAASQSPTPTASSDPRPVPTRRATSTIGPTLADLGFRNGPSAFTLPPDVTMSGRIDQRNVVAAFGPVADAATVLAYLVDVLEPEGWTITASGGESLRFAAPGWDGAFTPGSQQWALVLRQV